jgi:hypothetical protein
MGLFAQQHLIVSCGEQFAGLGLALYTRQPDGQIAIRWCSGEAPAVLGTGSFANPVHASFEGTHSVVYTFADGSLYGAWECTIRAIGALYTVEWRRNGNCHWRGIGLPLEDGLAVAWCPDKQQLAFLKYTCDSAQPDLLRCIWALGDFEALGDEVLIRVHG